MRRLLGTLYLIAAAALLSSQALAHVVLTETSFEAGRTFAAFFKVDEGCGNSPTVSLEVSIPESVIVLELPAKPAWAVSASRVPLSPPLATERGPIRERVTAVTWRGRLDVNTVDQFGLLVKLPESMGPLFFPAIQRCERGEARSTPVLNLVPAEEAGTHGTGHDHH